MTLVRFMIFRFKVMVDVSHLHLFLTSFWIFFSFSPSRSFLCLSVLCSSKPHQATSLKYVGPTHAKQLTICSRQESKKRVDLVVNTHHINL